MPSHPTTNKTFTILTASEQELALNLKKHVQYLANELGPRNIWDYANLNAAAGYIQNMFKNFGYNTTLQEFKTYKKNVKNISAEMTSENSKDIIIIGAHYDTVENSPGADDNASGVAAMLELARVLKKEKLNKTLRFVAFVNEEMPFFYTHHMGSYHYAKRCKQRYENIIAMFSLEMLGYYADQVRSQNYPFPFRYFYPSTANFIGFATTFRYRKLLQKVLKTFREQSNFPAEGIAAPSIIPGISWSDHRFFWKFGYPAIMITDTAFYRYPFYHTAEDTPEKLDYESMVRVVRGLANTIKNFSNTLQNSHC